jgi:3D (Asp-Asp-Asp) domain-containing protein
MGRIDLILLILLILTVFYVFVQQAIINDYKGLTAEQSDRLHTKDTTIRNLLATNSSLRAEMNTVNERIRGQFEVKTMEITFYAPLDPDAVEGMCYSGDPNITASGERVMVGLTAAADKSIPFGTRIFVEGFGWRVVHDRGGSIQGDRIDIAVATKEEALRLGRKQATVLIWKGEAK